jgi:hypothetical protein
LQVGYHEHQRLVSNPKSYEYWASALKLVVVTPQTMYSGPHDTDFRAGCEHTWRRSSDSLMGRYRLGDVSVYFRIVCKIFGPVYEGESVCGSQMNIKRKTCDIRT